MAQPKFPQLWKDNDSSDQLWGCCAWWVTWDKKEQHLLRALLSLPQTGRLFQWIITPGSMQTADIRPPALVRYILLLPVFSVECDACCFKDMTLGPD